MASETRELICINCPLGCPLTVTLEDGVVTSVTGNTCKRGEVYGRKEVTDPTRIVTTSVPVVGGDAERMRSYVARGESICGEFVGAVLTGAIRMGECNACMHRIVAAPTAGACGVMPAVLLPYARAHGTSADELVAALYIAAGFGMVIATRASMSGAEAGCQAEIGTASAMAAAALVSLKGGSDQMIAQAVAIALSNLMGLVCDPVAGLVEVPCVKRNVIGAMNAISAADMALAGIECVVPVDEVIEAMGEVGRSMPVQFRETALGGLANTPTGRAVRDRMQQNQEWK
jgi:L-serine dehydratase